MRIAMLLAAVSAVVAMTTDIARAQSTQPVGTPENPRQITSADRGPNIDPVKLAASRYNAAPLFNTFRSFMSGSFAFAEVWVYGMDIYYFGHYTAQKDKTDLLKKVRENFALQIVKNWPDAPTLADMKEQRVGNYDALYLRTDTPRPGALWRQWSFVADGHAFLIVSAMPKDHEAALAPQVDQMVASFKLSTPTTQPATHR